MDVLRFVWVSGHQSAAFCLRPVRVLTKQRRLYPSSLLLTSSPPSSVSGDQTELLTLLLAEALTPVAAVNLPSLVQRKTER